MPAKPFLKNTYTHWDRKVAGHSPVRSIVTVNGYHHKPEWPKQLPQNPVWILKLHSNEDMDWMSGDPNWDCRIDISSLTKYSEIAREDPRLYSTAYTKALAKARDGAELGMNILQYRKALSTFCQLGLLAGTVVSAFVKGNRIGLLALKERPRLTPKQVKREITRKEKALAALARRERFARQEAQRLRRRLKNEIFILRNIASTLLAYRYGVAPLMSDLYKTAHILSSPVKEQAIVRASAERSVAVKPNDGSWLSESWAGKERCSMRFAADVDNPNLFLANQLGLINPAYWLWDATPWSHIVDWWAPVGPFLNNFTASVGFVFKDAAVTWTSSGTCKVTADYWGTQFSGTAMFSYKTRHIGGSSLPPPTVIPYGTGLGIQRAQNALATIVQLLKLERLTKR